MYLIKMAQLDCFISIKLNGLRGENYDVPVSTGKKNLSDIFYLG